MKSGAAAKEHCAYTKHGSCSLLATIEPLTGKRVADVFAQRRKIEFARHFQKLAAEFPVAGQIIVILDNLNTHNANSFYKAFKAAEARRLTESFITRLSRRVD